MKNKILSVFLGISVISPLAAFADQYVVFQNKTGSTLNVQYLQCTDYPHTYCGDSTITPPISDQTVSYVKQQSPYTYIVVTGAWTKDNWTYHDPQTGKNCDMINYYISDASELATFTKSLEIDRKRLECQTSDDLAKKSK